MSEHFARTARSAYRVATHRTDDITDPAMPRTMRRAAAMALGKSVRDAALPGNHRDPEPPPVYVGGPPPTRGPAYYASR